MSLVQLYDAGQEDGSNKQPIYPRTKANGVTIELPEIETNNVEDCIKELYEYVGEMTQSESQINQVTFEILYTNSDSDDVTVIAGLPIADWNTEFAYPTSQKPYSWKRTSIKIVDKLKVVYEIVATADRDNSQLIYTAISTGDPNYEFIQAVDGNGNLLYQDSDGNQGPRDESKTIPVWDIDAMNDDNYLPGKTNNKDSIWSFTPQPISQVNSRLFIGIRFRTSDGKWGLYQGPYLYSQWVYDTTTVFKYITTDLSSGIPGCNRTEVDPSVTGFQWRDSITDLDSNFEGKIWMISANKSGNNFIRNDINVWSTPSIMSIVK